MKIINLIFCLALVSCSSIPMGEGVMKEEVENDRNRVPTVRKNLAEIKSGKRVQIVRSYATVLKDNVLNYESVYYVPLPEDRINWKQEVKITPVRKFKKAKFIHEREYMGGDAR